MGAQSQFVFIIDMLINYWNQSTIINITVGFRQLFYSCNTLWWTGGAIEVCVYELPTLTAMTFCNRHFFCSLCRYKKLGQRTVFILWLWCDLISSSLSLSLSVFAWYWQRQPTYEGKEAGKESSLWGSCSARRSVVRRQRDQRQVWLVFVVVAAAAVSNSLTQFVADIQFSWASWTAVQMPSCSYIDWGRQWVNEQRTRARRAL